MTLNNHINPYTVLITFLLLFCFVTIYYKPKVTNIEIHINRSVPKRNNTINDQDNNKWNDFNEKDKISILDIFKDLKLSYSSSFTTEFLVKDRSSFKPPIEIKTEVSPQNRGWNKRDELKR